MTLTNQQEERLVEALGLIVEAEPIPALATPRRDSPWRRPGMVPVLTFLAVLAVFLPFRLVDSEPNVNLTGSASFSPADLDAMEVSVAKYPFDIEAWAADRTGVSSWIAEASEEAVSSDMVNLVRAAVGDALSETDAEPPYSAQIVSAFEVGGVWNALVNADFADGQCLVVIDNGTPGFHVCHTNDSGLPEPILFDGGDPGFKVLPANPGLGGGSWVSALWWGLPPETTHVSYHTSSAAARSEVGVSPVLGGLFRIGIEGQGVGQSLAIEARDSQEGIVMTDTVEIPSFVADAFVAEPDAVVAYETDASDFSELIDDNETFLGGGYVNGEPWAIVGHTFVDEEKPTAECSGVRPILDEDHCVVTEGLYWVALPVGEPGGVLVVRAPGYANAIRVNLDDGTTLEAPLVGAVEGYPPLAVFPFETPGLSGTIYAVTADDAVLWAHPFEITKFSMPGG